MGREADLPPQGRLAGSQLLAIGLQGVREEVKASWCLAPEFPQRLPQLDMTRAEGGRLLAFDFRSVPHPQRYHERERIVARPSLILREEKVFWQQAEEL